MSQENVEIVRRAYASWNQGEHAGFFATLSPDIELVVPGGGMNPGVHRGPEAVRRFLENYLESFDDFTVEPEDFFTSGDEVVVFARM